jgi:hypothetical protein
MEDLLGPPEELDIAYLRQAMRPEREHSPSEATLSNLPSELLALLLLSIPRSADIQRLSATCQTFYRVSSIPGVRALWLVRKYGRFGAWRYGLQRHRRMMSGRLRDAQIEPEDQVLPELDLETDTLEEFDAPGFALNVDGPVPTVCYGLLALGLPPPRYLVQEYFGWFTNARNGFRAWERETGDAFPGFTGAQQLIEEPWDDDATEDNVTVILEPANLDGIPMSPADNDILAGLDPASAPMDTSTSNELPTTLSFLPLPPRPTPPPIPKPHDQILLTHLLNVASIAYGSASLALLGRDELVLERLLRLTPGPGTEEDMDTEASLFDNEEGGRRWLMRRKEAFARVKKEVLPLVFTWVSRASGRIHALLY